MEAKLLKGFRVSLPQKLWAKGSQHPVGLGEMSAPPLTT